MKTIKSISTERFELCVVEMSNGQYVVAYETNNEVKTSEGLNDYDIASVLFDMKLIELEGN